MKVLWFFFCSCSICISPLGNQCDNSNVAVMCHYYRNTSLYLRGSQKTPVFYLSMETSLCYLEGRFPYIYVSIHFST